ncbi:MAG: DNA-processing protein DprA [Candidatus Sedimenticola endophacoides]
MKKNNATNNKATMPAIEKIEQTDSAYPRRLLTVLKNKAPQTLYLQGNIDLLELDGIGFCGSRKSSQKGIDTVRDCAEQAANAGLTVVSGNAAGIDFEAHYHALSANGTTILVLPEGINHFRVKRALAPVWDWERTLVISQFNPGDAWKGYRAMTRNQVIIGLSKAMIVIEAGEKGGTMNAGTETLKRDTPLYVAEYQDMSVDARGNQKLLELGGKRLARSRSTGRANMKNIFDDIAKDPATSSQQDQIGLL